MKKKIAKGTLDAMVKPKVNKALNGGFYVKF